MKSIDKSKFIDILERSLGFIPKDERADIIYDYEEHFSIGLQDGKTEAQISAELGDPRFIAKQYKANNAIRNAESDVSVGNIFRAVLAAVGMGFFNLVIVLGPFIGLLAVLISLFAASLAVTFGGIAGILAVIAQPVLSAYIDFGGLDILIIIFASIGVTALGIIFFIGVCYVAKFFYKGVLAYLRWNMDIIFRK